MIHSEAQMRYVVLIEQDSGYCTHYFKVAVAEEKLVLRDRDSIGLDGNPAGLTKCVSAKAFPSITFLLSVIKHAK